MSSGVTAVARAALRRRWRTLLLIGLLAGVVAATSTSAVALARRTTTAYDRLGQATGVDDARGTVLRHPDLVEEILGLPGVVEGWSGGVGVAKLEESFTFLGITAGPRWPSTLLQPIVLEGRAPQAAAEPDVIEITLREEFQRSFDIPIGTEVPVRFLTEPDYFRFDTGFEGGEPHGPDRRLRVVGTVRLAGGDSTIPPAFASRDALLAHPDAFVGSAFLLQLAHGADGFPEVSAAIDRLASARTLPPEASEFTVVAVSSTAEAAAVADNTAELLGRALLAMAAAVGLVGAVAVAQAVGRHQAAMDTDREVATALGFTRGEQRAARLLVGSVPALLAVAIAAAGTAATGSVEPIGAIRYYEPAPGRHVNVALLLAGAALAAVVVLASFLVTARVAGRGRPGPARESALVGRVAAVGGSPGTVLGLRFALEPGRAARAVPVRSAIAGAVVGIAGVVAGLGFVASLDRLTASPARSAVPYDSFISDLAEADAQPLLADPLVGELVATASATVTVEGLDLSGHALTDLRGSLDVGVVEGRLPQTPDEITLGLRAAHDLLVGVGDTVTATGSGDQRRELAVVGTAVVPVFNGEQLGLNALLNPEGLRRVSRAEPFTGAAVLAAPGQDVGALQSRLEEQFEAGAPTVPLEIQNLEALGQLPAAVAALVGVVAVAALVNALVVVVRRRRGDLALLRALGFTSRQTRTTVVVMALTIVAIGVAVGVPVGMAAGSLLWRETAAGAFVATDVRIPWWPVLGVAGGAFAVALAAAVAPAWRAARQAPSATLRVE